MTDRWERVRDLVEEGTEIAAAERAAWLDRACAGDPELRREAEALIEASLRDESYLEPPRVESALAPGARLNGFRLERVIGAGGMGTVFLAEQVEPKRSVALKVMGTGLFSAGSASRFRHEVRVLAALEHPNIASMYETGVHADGAGRELPWFAMEYVANARPFREWARGRAPADVLAGFAQVCDAVDHGHRKGVIHRDLKPDNILVDAAGRPKVIDFGVARATGSDIPLTTRRTSRGEILGTLAYMSPEQMLGDASSLDTRSDLYSLGVVLYEALAGRLPYALAGKSFVEVARIVQSDPPLATAALRGDLETIVHKCLAKDADRRYGSAAALAQDLRRFLRREPIEAHPPSLAYQLRMYARRHRAAVATACIVFVVSVAAAIVSLAFLQQARRAETVAKQRGEDARELFQSLLDRSIATTARFAPRLEILPGGAKVTIEMTEATLKDLRTLEAKAKGDPEVLHQIAWAHLQLGAVQGDPTNANQLGDRAAAVRSYRHALGIAEALHADHADDDKIAYLLCVALERVGMFEGWDRAFDSAQKKLDRALGLAGALTRANPDTPTYVDRLSAVHGRLRHLAGSRGDEEAKRHHDERSLALAVQAHERWPEIEGVRYRLAGCQRIHAIALYREGDPAGAMRACDAALELLEVLVDDYPDNVGYRESLARGLMQSGGIALQLRQLDVADERHREALELYVAMREEDPDNFMLPQMVGMAQAGIGDVARRRAGVDGIGVDEKKAHLQAASDAYRAAWELFAELEKQGRLGHGHGSFAADMRARYEACRAALENG